MSRVVMIKCEMCPEHFVIPYPEARPYEYETPEGWITVAQGNPQHVEAQHFCSKVCIAKWAGVEGLQPPLVAYDAPPLTKMRRFLLVNGETADISEGVLFANGSVVVEGNSIKTYETWVNWEELKEGNDGSGIQWIDQEVSNAD